MSVCCFTGPRLSKLNFIKGEEDSRCLILKEKIYSAVRELYERGYTEFLSGMAEGVDIFCAEAVLSLKAEHPEILLHAVLPFPHRGDGRPEGEKERFLSLIEKCDSIYHVHEKYCYGCYYDRNRYMVDKSHILLAVFSKSGGTAYTIKYAVKQGKPVKVIGEI